MLFCIVQALTEVERKAPYFWSENPDVHFEFLAAKFQQLLDSGKTFDALSLVQSKLTPISNEHEALQPRLKARQPTFYIRGILPWPFLLTPIKLLQNYSLLPSL